MKTPTISQMMPYLMRREFFARVYKRTEMQLYRKGFALAARILCDTLGVKP